MNALIEKTTQQDQLVAMSSIEEILKSGEEVIKSKKQTVDIRIQESGNIISIPLKAFLLLKSILNNMAQGKSIAIVPSDSVVTTQQAAEMLNVSRPHIIKLLESGKIPFKKVGSHRRINLKDLLDYESNIKKIRNKNLDFLAKQAQELNLGYE